MAFRFRKWKALFSFFILFIAIGREFTFTVTRKELCFSYRFCHRKAYKKFSCLYLPVIVGPLHRGAIGLKITPKLLDSKVVARMNVGEAHALKTAFEAAGFVFLIDRCCAIDTLCLLPRQKRVIIYNIPIIEKISNCLCFHLLDMGRFIAYYML
jgi:hypothetical protein